MNSSFIEAKPILEKLISSGYQAFYVGGSVRDLLLEREIGDVDIATSAKPNEIKKLFRKTIDVGAEHGTIIVLHNETPYEVTTFRTETEYEDFRRPKSVSFISSLKEDLKRRDFTINAMAMDIDGEIIDYFNGKEDLYKKHIQTVGKASERFTEDALRMLRAVRFVSQLSFSLSITTQIAIRDHAHLLESISTERKVIEIEKLLFGDNFQEALKLLLECEVYSFLPGLVHKQDELNNLLVFDFTLITNREELWTTISYFIKPISVEVFLRSWKLPVKLIKAVEKNLNYLQLLLNGQNWTELLIYEARIDTALSAERIHSLLGECGSLEVNLNNVRSLYKSLPIKDKKDLNISGKEIIEVMNKQPGPWVTKAINAIEIAILKYELENNRVAIKEWLLSCNQNFEQSY
ncbi:tRNA nucleotidyltransferase (CCA-adding enzyme) [Metabacillus crassostreae]|uniref:CCA tRNA nucleotidyltransferase n=1 Tax=Metabacillus crassostreae TaxID=929098 RepID=UPI001959CD66|nr:CCA tRNA nucleotidyltransferase [Metabacillus crassostreae]MBM7604398.1 tRNA nucleotidyltransferase (CCA-adding enzyme) [Metabacillus crassostreae]